MTAATIRPCSTLQRLRRRSAAQHAAFGRSGSADGGDARIGLAGVTRAPPTGRHSSLKMSRRAGLWQEAVEYDGHGHSSRNLVAFGHEPVDAQGPLVSGLRARSARLSTFCRAAASARA